MPREYFKGGWQAARGFSPAVATTGGKMVFAAGHGALTDDDGRSLAGDFDAQARQSFKLLAATLARAGATLADLVTMTVFIIDARHGDRFTEIRAEFFPGGDYPASAMLTIAGFAKPEMMVEIQAIAVIEDG